ncbi:hypothetical protein C900_01677 [Fulvivirga imtechensis AK7]|uniref:Uncharacterized protein n=1 Tax=Fulvivirga imtechensis AK7 TaxID=1237149 RepID=L8JYK1_9BACT|nr:hypothetical protein C900_01677 [Fulvivirga imtechensis AK7]
MKAFFSSKTESNLMASSLLSQTKIAFLSNVDLHAFKL